MNVVLVVSGVRVRPGALARKDLLDPGVHLLLENCRRFLLVRVFLFDFAIVV